MASHVLMITANSADATTLEDVLGKTADDLMRIEHAHNLSEGLTRLLAGGISAVFVDSSLPDFLGIETFDKLFAKVPHIPIITLSENEDREIAVESVQRGAQGYLSKDHRGNFLGSSKRS